MKGERRTRKEADSVCYLTSMSVGSVHAEGRTYVGYGKRRGDRMALCALHLHLYRVLVSRIRGALEGLGNLPTSCSFQLDFINHALTQSRGPAEASTGDH
ncbi:hypothetical protein AcV5_007690 [Taiwanofungus camphoratus]|nr:hypothetical protein AcV5_007690 [Antrodia cinnamomea]